ICAVVTLLAGCGGSTPPVIVRTEPAGVADCPYGGNVVSTGRDRNGDGELQDAEVEVRTPVCGAAVMPPEIVIRLTAEPPGPHCTAGGTAVQSGIDTNHNARLD